MNITVFWSSLPRTLLFLTIVGISLVGLSATSLAEDTPSIEDMLQRTGVSAELPDDSAGLPLAPSSHQNVDLQWRMWLQSLQEGDASAEQLAQLHHHSRSSGRASLPEYQMAVLAFLRSDEAQANLSDEETDTLLRDAHRLSPHLPYAALDRARWLFDTDPTSIYQAIPAYITGVTNGFQWLDTRLAWMMRLLLVALIATSFALAGFLLAQSLRYFGIAAYDGTRLLPRGFSSTQTVILLLALVLVPGLVLQSPLLSLLLLALLLMPFQQLNERFVMASFFALMAVLPWADDRLADMATYPGSDAQRLLHAYHEGCGPDPQCRSDLEALAADGSELARLVERSELLRNPAPGDLDALNQWLNKERPADGLLAPHWDTLHGATLVALGRADEAIPRLEAALDRDGELVAPHFNLARAYQVLDDDRRAQHHLREAFSLDLRRTSAHLDFTRLDPHSFLMLTHIDGGHILADHQSQRQSSPSLIRPFWNLIAGPALPLERSMPMGVAGLLLLLLTAPLYLGRRVSSPCPKCGLARDPGDSETTGHHHYCLPCYQTFVSGASLDYHARVHNETTLGRRDRVQRFLRRLFSALTPGLGHVLGGHAIRGMMVFFVLVFGLFLALFPQGPFGAWMAPYELIDADWIGLHWVALASIGLAYTVGLLSAIRGVDATRLATRPSAESPHE